MVVCKKCADALDNLVGNLEEVRIGDGVLYIVGCLIHREAGAEIIRKAEAERLRGKSTEAPKSSPKTQATQPTRDSSSFIEL